MMAELWIYILEYFSALFCIPIEIFRLLSTLCKYILLNICYIFIICVGWVGNHNFQVFFLNCWLTPFNYLVLLNIHTIYLTIYVIYIHCLSLLSCRLNFKLFLSTFLPYWPTLLDIYKHFRLDIALFIIYIHYLSCLNHR